MEGEEDIIGWFEQVSSEAALAQSRTLRKILQQNYGVEYLKKWVGDVNIHEIPDDFTLHSIFTSSIPLSSHAHFEPFLQRIADGDSSPLLTQQPITTLSLRYVPGTPHSILFIHFIFNSIHLALPVLALLKADKSTFPLLPIVLRLLFSFFA